MLLLAACLIDINGRVIYINEALIKLLELAPNKVTRITSALKYQPFIDAGIAQPLRDCIDSSETAVIEHYFQRMQDKGIYIRIYAMPVTGDENVVVGVWAVVEDITCTRQLELALKASEDNYMSLVEASADGVMILQQTFRFHQADWIY
jgi:PAS domain-containing protein